MGKDKLKTVAKQFGIELYIEFFRDEIIATIKKFLSPLSPDKLKSLVTEGKALPIPAQALSKLKGYESYLEKIQPERLFEWIIEARPDLGQVLVSLGDEGAEYIVKLKVFILEGIRNPEEVEPHSHPKPQFVEASCDACGKKWPVPKEMADEIKVCPFCGEAREEASSQ